MTDASDRQWMQRALDLAAKGLYTTRPNPMVGCVLVNNGAVVGEGWHQRAGEPHAEVHALRAAGNSAAGATAYVTLEPCSHHGRTPPCVNALINAGVSRVVAAMVDPDPRVAGSGLARLREAGIAVESPLLAAQAGELNCGFLSRMERGRPWLRMKLAMSLDGRVALADGTSKWITGPAARADGHRWRARAGVILTGVGTVVADDPQLNVRIEDPSDRGLTVPLIVDSHGRCPVNAQIFRLHEQVWLAHRLGIDTESLKLPPNVLTINLPVEDSGRVSLYALMAVLAERSINEVHVEAGPELSAGLLQAGLVDELLLYQAGKVLGDQARSGFALPSPPGITDADWALIQVANLGGDCFSRWQRSAIG